MQKKKSTRKKVVKKESPVKASQEPEQSQFALRLKPDTFRKLKETAEKASISMNQLIQGICEAAVDNVRVGEPFVRSDGIISIHYQEGCVCFGKFDCPMYSYKGGKPTDEYDLIRSGVSISELEGSPEVERLGFHGKLWFGLDYSNRGYREY